MGHEVTSRFRVQEIVEAQGDVWLEDLHPQRSGYLVAVEMDAQYGPGLEDKIEGLDEGETCIATLKSQDKQHTVWHFSDITEEPSKQTGPVATHS